MLLSRRVGAEHRCLCRFEFAGQGRGGVRWGAAFGMLPIAVQGWMFEAAPRKLEAVQALFASLSQVAIGCGAFAGGQLVDHLGVTSPLWASAFTAIGTAAFIGASSRTLGGLGRDGRPQLRNGDLPVLRTVSPEH